MFIKKEIIDSFLEAISPLPNKLGSLEEDEKVVGLDEMLYKLRQIDPSATIQNGVSKMVIIADTLENVVIKIPFNGTYECVVDENDEYIWRDFQYAPSDIDESDYCLAEFETYRELRKQKLHSFVAKTVFYLMWDGYRIFIQEKVIPIYDDSHTPTLTPISQKAIDKVNDIPYRRGRSEWIARCIQTYGEKKTKRFFKYCEKENTHITDDFHMGNYGYRPNGTPCILDYSDYCECF